MALTQTFTSMQKILSLENIFISLDKMRLCSSPYKNKTNCLEIIKLKRIVLHKNAECCKSDCQKQKLLKICQNISNFIQIRIRTYL